MAYSQIEIASAPYGHVLRDHNLRIRDRERECSSKARSAFQKNIDEMVRDHLSNCWVGNEERNSFGVISMTERDENQVESEAMRRQSRILDRWAARQAREMITTLERQTHEAELLALSNVQTVSERTSTFLRETSPAPSDSSVELPNLKASSLVQMWKEFEAEAISPRGNQSGSMNFNSTVGNSRLNSTTSNIESASVGESSLGSEIFDAVEAPEDSFVEWESEQTASSGQHHPSLERQVSNVSEGTRVADIVRRLTSVNQTTHSSLTSSSSSCIEHDQEPPAVSEPSTPVDHSVSNQGEQRDLQFNRKRPRVRGREAIKDLFMQMERERQSELSKLAERHAVSMFPHRGRIQSLLRLKFLQREVVVQDQQRPASTASELNQLHGKSTIFLLREIFTVKSKQEGSASALNEVTFQTRTQSLNATQESGHSSVSDLLTGQEVNHDAVTELEHSVEIVTVDGSVPSTSNHSSPTVQQSEPSRRALKPTVPYRSEPSVSECNWSTAYRSVPSTNEHNGPTVDQSEPSTSAHKGPTAHHSEPSISECNGPTAYRSVPSTSEHNGPKFHQSEPSKSEHKGSTAHHSEPSISERNGPTAYRSVPSTSEHNGPKFHQSEPSRSEHKGSAAHHSEPCTSERNGTTAYHLEQSTSEHIQESDCWMSDVKRQDLCVDKFNSKGNIANEKDSNVWQRDVLTEGTELNTTPNTGPFDSWEMLTEEPDYNTRDLIQPTDGSWLNGVSPPPSGWECRRQTWYSDIFENDSDDEEIHELLERRTVSNLLASSFRERMDRLILSQLQRHLGILVDAEEVKLGEAIEYHYQEMGGDPDQVDSPSFQLPLPSRLRTWNQDQDQDHDSDLVAYTSLQPPQPSSSECQDSQQCSPFANPASLEMELIYDLKGHMERLQYEMSEIRKSIQSCVGMQVNLQNSIKQEVAAAVCRTIQGGEANSVAMRTGNCCICHSTQVDSLLYRCGHMCTCFKCAQELQWSRSSCPICRSEIVDVVRAYTE